MVEAQVHDSENQLVSRIVRTYNPAGLITDERPVVENPAAMLLDKFPAEERAKFKTDPAALQALNKGLSTLMGGKAETGTFNTYDDDNRLTTVVENTNFFQKITTINYNDHGDKAEERESFKENSNLPTGVVYSVDQDGALTPSDPTEKPTESEVPEGSDIRYTYLYDDHGNWTELTTTNALSSDSRPTVNNRKLTYY